MYGLLTVTLNPTVDISTSVPSVKGNLKLRCSAPTYDPGGGGINVSRAIHNLGGDSTAFVAVGGVNGQRILSLLAGENVRGFPFQIPGESRQSVAISETATSDQFRFVMPGPKWDQRMTGDSFLAIKNAVGDGDIVVVSGSQPPGVPDDYLANLADTLHGKAKALIVDTSGVALQAITGKPTNIDVLRMDHSEAELLAGAKLGAVADTADFARDLMQKGVARIVIIALGAEGTILVSEDQEMTCSCKIEKVESAIGAGDSFVAGFALAIAREHPLDIALQHGVAAASAALLTPATLLCRAEDAKALFEQCKLLNLLRPAKA